MTSKKQYYKLDEIGFIGTQKKKSKSQIKKESQMITEYIEAIKAGKVISLPL